MNCVSPPIGVRIRSNLTVLQFLPEITGALSPAHAPSGAWKENLRSSFGSVISISLVGSEGPGFGAVWPPGSEWYTPLPAAGVIERMLYPRMSYSPPRKNRSKIGTPFRNESERVSPWRTGGAEP